MGTPSCPRLDGSCGWMEDDSFLFGTDQLQAIRKEEGERERGRTRSDVTILPSWFVQRQVTFIKIYADSHMHRIRSTLVHKHKYIYTLLHTYQYTRGEKKGVASPLLHWPIVYKVHTGLTRLIHWLGYTSGLSSHLSHFCLTRHDQSSASPMTPNLEPPHQQTAQGHIRRGAGRPDAPNGQDLTYVGWLSQVSGW
jgi:hypothetical protein